jgi:CelD/BcsL family acetyltransferase involved in cellulose biosynthesis
MHLLQARFAYDRIDLDGITDEMLSPTMDWHQDDICPMLNLRHIQNDEDLMKFFKTSLRGDIRRQIRRLEEVGKLSYREFKSWEEVPQKTFAALMWQHALRWPKAYKAPRFHENLLRTGLRTGLVHFSTLSVGETEIAWHLGFSFRGRYYYYMPAGNQDYLKFSPTKVHLYFLVRSAVEQGYQVYDHLRGEENYKAGWSNEFQHVHSLHIKHSGVASRVKETVLQWRTLLGR